MGTIVVILIVLLLIVAAAGGYGTQAASGYWGWTLLVVTVLFLALLYAVGVLH